MTEHTRVALALGGGGARGYAHIGVIQALEERGYEVVNVAGTSMGAVVGGLYAAGRLDTYTQWVRTLTQRDVLRLLDPSFKAPGAIRAEKIFAKVSAILGDVLIEELPIAFTAVSTDLLAGKEVWFQHGPVHAAIRASIALPSFIAPVMMNGRLLVDGGLLNPIPVAATVAASRADFTVGVSLSEVNLTSAGTSPVRESAHARPSTEWLERSRRTLSQMMDSELVRVVTGWFGAADTSSAEDADAPTDRPADEPFDTLPQDLHTLEVMQLSLEVLQNIVMRYRLAAYPPDLLITIPKSSCRVLDFHRADEMIALGHRLATQALDREEPLARS